MAAILGEAHDHAGMSGAGDRAHDDVIEEEAQRGLLLAPPRHPPHPQLHLGAHHAAREDVANGTQLS